MKLVVGIPIVSQEQLTNECVVLLRSMVANTADFELVVIDNGSLFPYELPDSQPFPWSVLRNETNRGFYYPLLQLYERYPDANIIGLLHNDVFVYEHGFDERLRLAFASDPQLGLVGFCGSFMVDAAGGRGGGTMMNFRGARGQQQAGFRFADLRAAITLDSLSMFFRRDVIPKLGIDESIALCHFYDRIWSFRTIEAGYRVGVLPIEIDHLGGQTSTSPAYVQAAMEWCYRHHITIENGNADLAMYLEGERRYLSEYRDQKHLLPSRIDESYVLTYG